MERLTERFGNGIINVKYASQHETAIHRLAAYEDTGLEPEEIIELKARMEGLEK